MKITLCATFGACLLLVLASGASATGANWVCMKDGAPVAVKGNSARDKEASCKQQGGSWVEAKADAKGAGSAQKKQSSGGGGGW